jgi:hypothetical protein
MKVNINLIPGYRIKVIKGTPHIRVHEQRTNTLVFESYTNFELNITKNGNVLGYVMPGKAYCVDSNIIEGNI